MQSLGDDLIVTDDASDLQADKVRKLCDRHFGVGGDGLLSVAQADRSTVYVSYWRSDGTQQEVTPNALMCAVRFAIEFKMTVLGDILLESSTGFYKGSWDGVDPKTVRSQVGKVEDHHRAEALHGYEFNIATLGGLHAIAIVDDIAAVDLDLVGPNIENNPAFSDRVSVVFVQVTKRGRLELLEWERGVGRTYACGTGIVTGAIVAEYLDKINFPVLVHSLGGTAKIWVDEDGYANMQAPAELIFDACVEV